MANMERKTKFKKAPCAPKRFKSGYMFYSEHQHKVIREKLGEKKIRAADAAKMVSKSWKELSDQDRHKWLEMARLDRERYEREKAAYKGPWKVPDMRDPNEPKKPMSAFLAFGNERRRAIAEANPHMSNAEISAMLSKLWKECPNDVKQSYRDREAHEREQFKQYRANWQRQNDESLIAAAMRGRSGSFEPSYRTLQRGPPGTAPQSSIDDTAWSRMVEANNASISLMMRHTSNYHQAPLPFEPQVGSRSHSDPASHSLEHQPILSQENIVHGSSTSELHPQPFAPITQEISRIQVSLARTSTTGPFPIIAPSIADLRLTTSDYSLEDLLQNEELFREDFSPQEVPNVPVAAFEDSTSEQADPFEHEDQYQVEHPPGPR